LQAPKLQESLLQGPPFTSGEDRVKTDKDLLESTQTGGGGGVGTGRFSLVRTLHLDHKAWGGGAAGHLGGQTSYYHPYAGSEKQSGEVLKSTKN